MNETEFLLFQNILAAIQICLYAVILAVFLRPFMTGKRMGKMILVFLIFAVIYFAKELSPFSISGWPCMILVLVLLMAVSGYLGMERGFILFLGTIFFSVRNLCILSMQSINFFTSRHFVKDDGNLERIFRNAAINNILVEVIQFFLFLFLLYIAYRQLRECRRELHIRELSYLLLTPVTGIFFVNIIFQILIVVTEDLVLSLYEQYPVLVGAVPVTAALFYTGILVTVMSYRQMVGLQEERKKYFVEEQQVHAIQERMEEVDQFYNGIRQMKHEMKNHLTNIQGLLKNGDYEEMEQYIAKIDEGMEVFALSIKTGNAVTDVIINDKCRSAKRQETRFQSQFCYPVSGGYNAFDIGIIINNLLQNALEACDKMQAGERYIFISGRQKKKFFFIKVINSFEGEIVFDKSTHLPKSTKGEGAALHGIGLSNVRREVLKYMGDIDIKVKKNEFNVTVMLQEKEWC